MSKHQKPVKASDTMSGMLMLEKHVVALEENCSRCHYLGLREGREHVAKDSTTAIVRYPCRRFPAVEWKMAGEFCGEFKGRV